MTTSDIEHLKGGVESIPDLYDGANEYFMDWQESRNVIDNFPMTPDKMEASEHSGSVFYATRADAHLETQLDFVRVLIGLALFVGAIIAGTDVGAVSVLGGWLTFALGLPVAYFAMGALTLRKPVVTGIPKYVLFAMTEARDVWESANDENTTPGLLAEIQRFRTEIMGLAHSYATLASEVDREQCEINILTACAITMHVRDVAVQRRAVLYADLRTSYFSAVEA